MDDGSVKGWVLVDVSSWQERGRSIVAWYIAALRVIESSSHQVDMPIVQLDNQSTDVRMTMTSPDFALFSSRLPLSSLTIDKRHTQQA